MAAVKIVNGRAATRLSVLIPERPHPRSDEMTPCIPEYLRLLIADPFALMPPRDPNDDDDDEDEDEDEEDDEDDNDKNAVPMT
jgi:hypothetical protein